MLRKLAWLGMFVGAGVLIAAACGDSSDDNKTPTSAPSQPTRAAVAPAASPTMADQGEMMPLPPGAENMKVQVTSPANGATITDNTLALSVAAQGFDLTCAEPAAYRQPAGTAAADAGRAARADVVLFTTPTFVTLRLAEWPADYASRLDAWTYETAVVLLLELRRPYGTTFWTNVADPAVPFLGLVEHTNLVPPERDGARYLYVSNYVAPDDPLARMATEDLYRYYLSALRLMNPAFDERDVLRHWSFREEAAQPVPRVGNRHRILPFTSSRRGLYLANTTQIYPEDRGTNYSVRLGRNIAARIAADLVSAM